MSEQKELKQLIGKNILEVIVDLPNHNLKSGYPKIRTPIMLCLKALGIHTAPPGNSYNFNKNFNI